MWQIEAIGIAASVLILTSMLFPTMSFKGSLCMRIINLIGSAAFVVYGSILPAISTAILNGALVIVNFYYAMKLVHDHRKEMQNPPPAQKVKTFTFKTERFYSDISPKCVSSGFWQTFKIKPNNI